MADIFDEIRIMALGRKKQVEEIQSIMSNIKAIKESLNHEKRDHVRRRLYIGIEPVNYYQGVWKIML